MKTFIYTTFLLLFLGVIGVVAYVFVQFGGVQHFAYQLGREEVPFDTEAVNFVQQEDVVNGTYTIDTASSTVTWTGSRPSIRNTTHRGTIGIMGGLLVVADKDSIGHITLSMQDVTVLNEDELQTAEIHALLTGPHFFDSEHFPTSTFIITKVEKNPENANNVTVFATLEMHGQTRELTFPATIYMKDDLLRIAADLSLNRLEWGMTYNSASMLGKLAESAIEDMVEVSLDITAVR